MQSELFEAYKSTDYRILLEPPICIHIGITPKPLIQRYPNTRSFTIITADNPHSKRQSATVNTGANRRLLSELKQLSAPVKQLASTEAVDQHHQWPTEYGYLVANLTESEAVALARTYQQHAIVYLAEPDFIPVIVKID